MGDLYKENLKKCVDEALTVFSSRFGGSPEIAVFAPGRVNLIGEHTDYNDGYVLPMALPLMTVIVGQKCEGAECKIVSTAKKVKDEAFQEFPVPKHPGDSPHEVSTDDPTWIKYVKGVVALMNKDGDVPSFEAVITSCVPLGGGVSSSAALEVAMGIFVEQLLGKGQLPRKELAIICQQAEHRYAGNKCGIMDQFISVLAKEGHALLIDCKDQTCRDIPLDDPNLAVLVTDTGVRHELVGSEYNDRRKSCQDAAKKLGAKSLRYVSAEKLTRAEKSQLSEEEMKRARHVISEITRTEQAEDALCHHDYEAFGQLMNQSHSSLKNDYEVSCDELDQIVEIARQDPQVYGSRMTGGGFGGCTVTLLPQAILQKTKDRIKAQYKGNAIFYEASASPGAGVVPSHLWKK